MTDARFPERLLADRRLLRLSSADFRSYVMAMIWSVSNRTDGCVMPDELALIPHFALEAVDDLVKLELWIRLGAGYLITDFEAWQTSRSELEVLENARRRDREKKQRQRAAAKSVPGDKPEGVSFPSESPGTGAGTTQAGRKASDASEEVHWPVAEIGQGRRTAS